MFIQRKKFTSVYKCSHRVESSQVFTVGDNLALFFALFWRLYQLSSCSARTMEKRRRKSKSVSKEFRSAHADINILKENAFLLKQLREVLAVVFVVCGYVFIIFHLRAVVFVFFLFFLFFLMSPWLCFLDFP